MFIIEMKALLKKSFTETEAGRLADALCDYLEKIHDIPCGPFADVKKISIEEAIEDFPCWDDSDEDEDEHGDPDEDEDEDCNFGVTNNCTRCDVAVGEEVVDAVADALGYYPDDDNQIAEAVDAWKHLDDQALAAEEKDQTVRFDAAGGRGVEEADELDSLRIALAVRKIYQVK